MARKFDVAAAARTARIYASPEIAQQRARTRAALAARADERGLDVGCGPGFLACELASEVGPAGRIVAGDTSPDMLVVARRRAKDEGLEERIGFALIDAARLACRPATFDFVVAVQVYLYVPEIESALAEAARVLRPGGRVVVVDTDWDSCVWLTGDRGRHQRVMEARVADFAHAHLPPRLPGLLRRAGLTIRKTAVIPVLNLAYAPDSFSAGIIGPTVDSAIRQGIPRDEAEAWAADLRERTGDDYFFSVNRYLFLAMKP